MLSIFIAVTVCAKYPAEPVPRNSIFRKKYDDCGQTDQIITELISIKTAYVDSRFNKIPPGLYLAYFNRFSNVDPDGSFWAMDSFPWDFFSPSTIEEEFSNIFEILTTYLSDDSLKNVSLLDISVLGAKNTNKVSA